MWWRNLASGSLWQRARRSGPRERQAVPDRAFLGCRVDLGGCAQECRVNDQALVAASKKTVPGWIVAPGGAAALWSARGSRINGRPAFEITNVVKKPCAGFSRGRERTGWVRRLPNNPGRSMPTAAEIKAVVRKRGDPRPDLLGRRLTKLAKRRSAAVGSKFPEIAGDGPAFEAGAFYKGCGR